MHGPTTRRSAQRRSRRVPRRVAVLLATLSLIGVNLSGLDVASTPSAGATPSVSSLTLPSAGLNPTPASTTQIVAQAIACPSSTFCVATGDYAISSSTGGDDGFAATGNLVGGTWNWTMSTMSSTGLNPARSTVNPITYPYDISCPSSTSCVISGQYYDTNSGYNGFFAAGTLSAGQWSWSSSTLPTASLLPALASTPRVYPQAISCPTTTSCVATGYYVDGTGRWDGIVVSGTSGASSWTWTPKNLSTSSPTLTNGASATRVIPTGIACPSASDCVLTGTYNPSGFTFPFYATGSLSAATWTWTLSTLPTSSLVPAPSPSTDITANSISCPTTTTCVTTGQYYVGLVGSLLQYDGYSDVGTLNGATWSWTTTTFPVSALSPSPQSPQYTTPTSVSCASATSCVASGWYLDSTNYYHGFFSVGTSNANVWTWSSASVPTTSLNPAPKSLGYAGDFTANLSCPSAARCVVAGSYRDTNSHVDAYSTSLVLLAAASAPSITNLPSSATVGDQFSALVSTNGDGVLSLSSSTPRVCTVAGLVVNFVSTGTCTLVASVGDGASYAGATGNSQSFAVSAGVTTTTIPIGTHATQSKLFVSSKKVAFALHSVVTLTTSGGSGSGKVTFRLLRGRCVLTTNHLRAKSASACTVVATKAGNTRFKTRSSSATTFYFGFRPQSALILRVSSRGAKHSSRVTLSTTGGSGRGAVSYAVTGSHCTISRSTLRASSATSCVVTATKASSATFLPATSKPAVVKFS